MTVTPYTPVTSKQIHLKRDDPTIRRNLEYRITKQIEGQAEGRETIVDGKKHLASGAHKARIAALITAGAAVAVLGAGFAGLMIKGSAGGMIAAGMGASLVALLGAAFVVHPWESADDYDIKYGTGYGLTGREQVAFDKHYAEKHWLKSDLLPRLQQKLAHTERIVASLEALRTPGELLKFNGLVESAMKFDSNNDDQIDIRPESPENVRALPQGGFSRLNGVISAAEPRAFEPLAPVGPNGYVVELQKFDKDFNSRVTKKEFVNGLSRVYSAVDYDPADTARLGAKIMLDEQDVPQ